MNRCETIISASLVVLVLAACGGEPAEAGEDATARPVVVIGSRDLAAVETRRLAAGVPVTGSLDPAEHVEIKSQLAGRLQSVMAEAGSEVRRDQVLARVSADAVRSMLTSAQGQLASAQRDYEAAQVLHEAGAMSEQNFVNARATYEAARAQVAQAGERVRDATIASPINGAISEKLVSAGEAVQVGQHLFTVVNTATLELVGQVPPDQVARIRVDQPVILGLDAYPGREIEGRVARIEPVAEAGTRLVNVFIRVPNPDRALVGGLFAAGTILTEENEGPVPTIPVGAVRAGGEKTTVLTVSGGRLVEREVTLGGRDEAAGLVEVLTGVQPGDSVLVSSDASLEPGDSVQLAGGR